MNRNTDIRSFERLGLQDLAPRELRDTEGGSRPPITLMQIPSPGSVTFKYLPSTPDWVVQMARDVGFPVEQI